MSPLKFIWGLLFRLFPCPVAVGLRRIGSPDRSSPILVTCNFYLTVRRLSKALKGRNVWLLVAGSKGVNVWCAAGAEEFNTRSVVSVVKTSEIGRKVDHRRLILPPLGAPGICARTVHEQTGWKILWGPVRCRDIPRFLDRHMRRDETMKRVTYDWRERLDTGLGALFVFYLSGALGFTLFGRHLLIDYLLIAAGAFVFFMSTCPWLPGRRGLTKVLFLASLPALGLVINEIRDYPLWPSARADMIIALTMLFVYGSELGGLSATMSSDLDPLLARLGIGTVGNVALAGTVRTELLNGYRILRYDEKLCVGCGSCIEVCPRGVWEAGPTNRAVLAHREKCTACRACLVQCGTGAIKAEKKEIPGRAGAVGSGRFL